jgi:hypothetical protein
VEQSGGDDGASSLSAGNADYEPDPARQQNLRQSGFDEGEINDSDDLDLPPAAVKQYVPEDKSSSDGQEVL